MGLLQTQSKSLKWKYSKCWTKQSGSQFCIYTAKTEQLDGKHVVLGKVIENMSTAEDMEHFGSRNGKTNQITIAGSGQF